MYLDDEQAGDHLFRRAQEWRAGDEDTKRLQTLSKALDDLEPLRKGCGLYLDEVENACSAVIQPKPSTQSEPDPTTRSSRMSFDEALKKALAIARSEGFPVYNKKPTVNAMAKRVGCSHHLISKAIDESKSLRYYRDLASRQGGEDDQTDPEREIRILAREQELDDKRLRY